MSGSYHIMQISIIRTGSRARLDPQHHGVRSHKSIMYGNGCRHYEDCFTCPFPDCKYSVENAYKNRR